MTILRSGSTKKYSDNWAAAFGKKTTKKKVAKKKVTKKKVTRKKAQSKKK